MAKADGTSQPDPSPEDSGAAEEQNPYWREPPPPPEIPDLLQKPVEHKPSATTDMGGAGFSDASKAWAIAMDFVFTIIGAMLLGYFLDRWQGTMPRYTFIGLAGGLTLALYRFIRRTLADERREKEQRNRPK